MGMPLFRRWDLRTAAAARRLPLLVTVAVLAVLSLACVDSDYGITEVGADAAGALYARHDYGSTPGAYYYQSWDGGFTWEIDHTRAPGQESGINWGGLSAETPRGIYVVSGTDIIRTDADGRSFYYSTAYLADYANLILQYRDDNRAFRAVLTTKPSRLYYDPASGNVVAAMGTQGVAVGAPGGQWTRVAVGRLTPTDFGRLQRMGLLVSVPSFWLTTLALLVAFPAGACVLAACRWREIGGAVITAAVVLAVGYAIRAGNDAGQISDTVTTWAMLSVPVAGIILVASGRIHRGWHKSVALTIVGFMAAAVIWGFPGFNPDYFPETDYHFDILFPLLLIATALAVGMTVFAVWRYRPRGSERRAALVALGVVLAAAVLPTALWLGYAITYEAARILSLGLAGVAAVAFWGWLKWRGRVADSGLRRNDGWGESEWRLRGAEWRSW